LRGLSVDLAWERWRLAGASVRMGVMEYWSGGDYMKDWQASALALNLPIYEN